MARSQPRFRIREYEAAHVLDSAKGTACDEIAAFHPCDFGSGDLFVCTVSPAAFPIHRYFSCVDVFTLTCLITTETSYGERHSALQMASLVTAGIPSS